MTQCKVIAIGKRMPDWVNQAWQEYAKRLQYDMPLQLVEVAAKKRSKNTDLSSIQRQEGERCLTAIAPQDYVIALDENGKCWPTTDFAKQLGHWLQYGKDLCFLIGGPEGLADTCRQRADTFWSLSPLTLAHPLVRVVLAEQLYRAWSLLNNHPYHRA